MSRLSSKICPSLQQPERFPDTQIIDSFDVRDWKDIPLDKRTYVVVVTREHATDQAIPEQLLGKPLAYLGMIGSQRKVTTFQKRLLHKGFPEAEIAQIHAPIGLPIGAETLAEIALAIAAELTAVRSARRNHAAKPAAQPHSETARTAARHDCWPRHPSWHDRRADPIGRCIPSNGNAQSTLSAR